ncbi:hypothetical protein [Globicatella sanguinis]|uniref:hypothetical protein n=1 Tax=Globicatella sanguinis TaxID=13076 RepID=UPI0025436DA2|nr:hypothetical protein [Globicatella sanguinis]MDK7631464.1 hypothetical protein [Globicatella sanguinis]WIK67064.1 hypothetical protein CYJ72_002945 [Globicatella sanguinis]WKT56469.1 hypothetical protein Q3C38_02945 [Globicatella sanguinis]
MEYDVINCEILTINEEVFLKSDEKLLFSVNLSSSDTNDIKQFFDNIFDYVVSNEKLIEFNLINMRETDLYTNVAQSLINQINSEIKISARNFEALIRIRNEMDE